MGRHGPVARHRRGARPGVGVRSGDAPRLAGRRPRRAGCHDDPGHRRGPAARRRRLRGRAPLRRPAVRPRRPPRAPAALRRRDCGCRPTSTRCARDRRAARGGRAAATRCCGSWSTRGGRRIAIVEPLPARPAERARGHRHVRADARPRQPQDALLRRQHARGAARQGGRGRRGAVRHAARARARGADVVVLLGRGRGPAHAAARGAHPRLDHPRAPARGQRRAEERSTLDDLRGAEEAFIASTRARGDADLGDRRRALPPAPGPVTEAAHAALRSLVERELGAALRSPAGAGPHRHRQPAAVRQGGGRLPPPARRRRRGAGPHRPALRRRPVAGLLRRARAAAPEHRLDARRRLEHRADGAHARGRSSRCSRRGARRRARLRRHELDARRRARRGAGRAAGRARRGRDALVRPRDARGAQPRPHRPPRDAAAVLVGARRPRTCGARRVRGEVGRGGRRDGRRRAAARPARPRRHGRRSRRPASSAGELRARHRAPGGQRRRPGAPGAARRAAGGAAGAGRAAAAPAHARAGSRRPACSTGSAAAGAAPRRRRSATSTSRRCCATPGPCSPTPAACRRRPTSRACRASRCATRRSGRETVEAGWNTLVDLDADAALAALARAPPAERPPLYGDGRAGERVVAALTRRMAA